MEPLKIDWESSDYLNYFDLNRIEEWNEKLVKDLQNLGYGVKYERKASPWTVNDIPTLGDINRIRRNIENLRNGFFAVPEWREMIFSITHDFEQQNAMEWDLQQCFVWYERLILIFPKSNTYESGCVGYIPEELEISNAVPFPSLLNESLVYNGEIQSPGLSGENVYTFSGTFEEEDAGQYSFEIVPKPFYKWTSNNKEPKKYSWEIQRADPVFEVERLVVLDKNKNAASVPITYVGDGKLKIYSNSKHFEILDTSNNVIKIVAKSVGTGVVVVEINGQKNYNPLEPQTIKVSVESLLDVSPTSGTYNSGSYYYFEGGI